MFSFLGRRLIRVAMSATLMMASVCFAQQNYTISIVAGGGNATPGNGGPATNVLLYEPYGVAEDANGTIYFAEAGRSVIRKVTTEGVISTIAGQYGNGGFSGDGGPAVNAKLSSPYGLAIDTAGNLFVADTVNGRIRKISTSGMITTAAGGGNPPCCGIIGDGGPATNAVLAHPENVVLDGNGNMYITEPEAGRVRKVDVNGIITTAVKTPKIETPISVALDSSGNLYVVSSSQSQVFKISTAGTISTFAGNGTNGYSGDGGLATSAELSVPRYVAIDSFGYAYIADYGSNVVRVVNTSGVISTIAGGAPCCSIYDGQPATSAWITSPESITIGAGGNIYFTEGGRVVRLTLAR